MASPLRSLLVVAALALSACSDASPTTSAPLDAAPDRDAAGDAAPRASADASIDATIDATSDATSTVASDAAAVDVADGASGSDEILGTLRGMCGTLRAMLRSPAPSLLRDDLTFMAPERYAREALSPGGQRLFDTANAGGSSNESEVFSYEVLHFCDGASLRATETEIHYAPPDDSGANSITDLLVEIGGERVGVSVTRAYRPPPMTLTDADVMELLVRKLVGVNRSSMRVLPADRWVKQILHVFAVDDAAAARIDRVWRTLDPAVRADTIVLVTVTHGGGFIYCNPDPPLGMECPPIRP